MASRTAFEQLLRARAALAKAQADGSDPWRVAELRAKHDALADALAGYREPELAHHEAPAPRGPVDPIPLAWVDEAGRVRKPGRGAAS